MPVSAWHGHCRLGPGAVQVPRGGLGTSIAGCLTFLSIQTVILSVIVINVSLDKQKMGESCQLE